MKFSKTLSNTILLMITIAGFLNSKVIRKQSKRLFSNNKSLKKSSQNLSDTVHPSRFLKEEKFMPGIPAKLKLFMHSSDSTEYKAPGKIFLYQKLIKHIILSKHF